MKKLLFATALCFCTLLGYFIGAGGSSQQAQENSPKRLKARTTMCTAVQAFGENNDIARARKDLLQSCQDDPSYPEPRYNLAKLDEKEGNWDSAIRWLTECQKLAKGTPLYAKAAKEIESVKGISSRSHTPEGKRALQYDSALAGARQLISSHHYKEAFEAAQECIHMDESRYEAYAVAAAAKQGSSEFYQAVESRSRCDRARSEGAEGEAAGCK